MTRKRSTSSFSRINLIEIDIYRKALYGRSLLCALRTGGTELPYPSTLNQDLKEVYSLQDHIIHVQQDERRIALDTDDIIRQIAGQR